MIHYAFNLKTVSRTVTPLNAPVRLRRKLYRQDLFKSIQYSAELL